MSEQEWGAPVTLEHARLRMEPLRLEDASEIVDATDLKTFELFTIQPTVWTVAGCRSFIEAIGAGGSMPLLARRPDGRVVGGSCYFDIQPAHKTIEVGGTWIFPAERGTDVNPTMKLLMLTHAFEVLGAQRVTLKTHHANLRSQRAIEKLGAVKEGVLRDIFIMPDGSRRSSVMYSILDREWPAVRERLLERIRGADGTACAPS